MGRGFKWLSSFGSDFNYDYGVSFTPEALHALAFVQSWVRYHDEYED